MKATKEVLKEQSIVQKETEKSSLIIILPIKFTPESSIEVVIIIQPIKVVEEEEGSKIITITGWKIKLL